MLGRRRRQWPNIKPALVDGLVFAGIGPWYRSVAACGYIHGPISWTNTINITEWWDGIFFTIIYHIIIYNIKPALVDGLVFAGIGPWYRSVAACGYIHGPISWTNTINITEWWDGIFFTIIYHTEIYDLFLFILYFYLCSRPHQTIIYI